jgi:transposase, IS30 family
MRYLHLTLSIRYQIALGIREGLSVDVIARRVGVHRSTVYREIKRGGSSRGYDAQTAQRGAQERARRSAANHPTKPAALWREVRLCVRQEYSPDEICGRLACLNLPSVSVPAIYAHIWRDRAQRGTLHEHLRYAHRRTVWYGRARVLRGDKVSIRKRPRAVQARGELGHWEGDTMMGRLGNMKKLLVLTERKSRLVRIHRPDNACSGPIAQGTIHALKRLPVHSITFDNGNEFSDYKIIEAGLNCQTYFADPGKPWQRGTCENTIGLIRQYIPKGSSGMHLSDRQLQRIADKLNHRPRKCLGYRTPHEVLFNLTPVALRT